MEGNFQKAYKNLSEYIRTANLEQAVTKEFADLETHFARIEYTLALPQAIHFLSSQPASSRKNLAKAKSLKVAGNKCFEQKKFQAAVNAYSEAIRFVPSSADDGLSAVCFANRSASLFSLRKYTECLSDIGSAISHGYPQQSIYKLRIRQTKCHQFHECEKFQSSLSDAFGSLDFSDLDETSKKSRKHELKKLSIKPLSVDLPNKSLDVGHTALSDCVKINEDNEFGRFVQTTKDVASGDVILIEKPFCSVTLPGSQLTHCNHCQLRVEWTPYPCRLCADIIYCGQKCEESAWQSYHRFECEYMLRILDVNVNMGHLSLRSALQPGFETMSSAAEGRLETNDRYKSIYDLQGHEKERSSQDLFWRTVASIVLANMCNVNEWAKGDEKGMFVLATAVLHHLDTFPCNAHEISELIYDKGEPCKSELVAIGAGIYQSLSMFNHSCDPSVVRTFCNGSVCVMKALSPIARNEQVYDNYGCLYATHHAESRRSKLKSQYYFDCICTPCVHQWPPYEALSYDEDPTYKCFHCGGMVLPPYADKCDECDAAFDKDSMDQVLSSAKQQFDKVMAQLFAGSAPTTKDLLEKATKLENYSQIVNRLVFRPYKTLNDCQEGLKHIYSLLGNVSVKY